MGFVDKITGKAEVKNGDRKNCVRDVIVIAGLEVFGKLLGLFEAGDSVLDPEQEEEIQVYGNGK